ncbi:hypothetical protein PanWU01x14_209490 [Parasponia andersonii]|uniref:Transmembrane protein n=1 Tax=Parasponia andersonii TaxID=3476 RepID=A0A2P5BUG8_PARAD|nr:hypothetical protein PanWU01x14_209490 [Parasponia andersonii]
MAPVVFPCVEKLHRLVEAAILGIVFVFAFGYRESIRNTEGIGIGIGIGIGWKVESCVLGRTGSSFWVWRREKVRTMESAIEGGERKEEFERSWRRHVRWLWLGFIGGENFSQAY